ncbi:hypothetical protein [Lacipirellula sp.]|uniref:hypothetical protein n=1 Tax=Lacipirellula sp. TaxID=2691419 RepID=UPI003D0B9718
MRRTTTVRVAAIALATFVWQTAAHGVEGQPNANPYASGAETAAAGNPFRAAVESPALPDGTLAVPSTKAPTAAPSNAAAKGQSDQLLLDARRALSVGDLPRAQQFLAKAQELKVAYDGQSDSPQAVFESIGEYQEAAAMRNLNGGANWRIAYSKFLVKQADALLSWNDLDTAARAANEAAQLNPQFSGNGITPQDVLRRVEQRRKSPTSLAVTETPAPAADAKLQTLILLGQARTALAAGNLPEAQLLAGKASSLNVPDSQFGADEDRPSRLALDIQKAASAGAVPAGAQLPTTATPGAGDLVQAAASSETGAAMKLAQVPEFTPTPLPNAAEATPLPGDPAQMLEAGEQALRAGDREGALQSFKAAYQNRAQLDVLSQQRLQGHMQMLQGNSPKESLPNPGNLLDSAAEGQAVLVRQISADVLKRQSEAEKLRSTDPKQALKLLEQSRAQIEESQLSQELKSQLLRRIELTTSSTNKYIEDHKAELDLKATNDEILSEVHRSQAVKLEVQQKMAQMVDEFNKLVDEHRYAEAEVVANRLYEMAPDELVAQQVNKQAKLIRRERWNQEIIAKAENGAANMFLDVRDTSAKALAHGDAPFAFPTDWDAIKNRKSIDLGSGRNAKELEIEQKLKTPVLPKYNETPLTKVVEGLSQLAGVNIHLDPRGLSQEGVRSDTPITLNLPQEISLKSALTLILEPLHLTYTIQDEVLKITSEQIRDGDLKIVTYPVGDLVIPIPNFVPTNNIGLQGLINDAYAAMGAYGPGGVGGPVSMVANNRPGQPRVAGAEGPVQANFAAPANGPVSTPAGGPGGLGGAASADFDSLIDLIVSTVEHESWMENGTGEGEIQPFPTNLSLVISQTQRVHEQIADLLEQLRRLQDLQVTIEVRFIRLTDRFFERIGVDFDFNITDRTGLNPADFAPGQIPPTIGPSATVGLSGVAATDSEPNYSVDLDLPFRQGSFSLATPQFGGPQDVGTFGFAILSDIEAFFVINASQGDQRANVLQAPKVTLFNGQQANVIDSSFRPFVISVIPVVGEFAAAQQPVIVVLSEGTMMTVQAVVSDDRRYVRLTLVPFFSQIGDVQTFTFEGSESISTSNSNTDDNDGESTSEDETETTSRSGTTVQLPTFQVITVSTTVSVPDGGTVLLGGIKRLVEGRNEFGVPLLSKVPYIDRLFRNVGIGRETDSLMMMVTPHIIIQEEEEDRLGIASEQ